MRQLRTFVLPWTIVISMDNHAPQNWIFPMRCIRRRVAGLLLYKREPLQVDSITLKTGHEQSWPVDTCSHNGERDERSLDIGVGVRAVAAGGRRVGLPQAAQLSHGFCQSSPDLFGPNVGHLERSEWISRAGMRVPSWHDRYTVGQPQTFLVFEAENVVRLASLADVDMQLAARVPTLGTRPQPSATLERSAPQIHVQSRSDAQSARGMKIEFLFFGFDPCKALVTLCVRPGNRFDLSLSDSRVYCLFHGIGSVKTAAYLSRRVVPMSSESIFVRYFAADFFYFSLLLHPVDMWGAGWSIKCAINSSLLTRQWVLIKYYR